MRIPLTTSEPVAETQPLPEGKNAVHTGDNVEVPYMDYESTHNHSYLVDHFQLGDTWNDPVGGFPKEIGLIEEYMKDKITKGEVANSITAIKNVIKDMEKFNNLTKEERAVVKLEVLAHYVEFIRKNDQTKSNLRRYNNV